MRCVHLYPALNVMPRKKCVSWVVFEWMHEWINDTYPFLLGSWVEAGTTGARIVFSKCLIFPFNSSAELKPCPYLLIPPPSTHALYLPRGSSSCYLEAYGNSSPPGSQPGRNTPLDPRSPAFHMWTSFTSLEGGAPDIPLAQAWPLAEGGWPRRPGMPSSWWQKEFPSSP